jgi:hypothetical protein
LDTGRPASLRRKSSAHDLLANSFDGHPTFIIPGMVDWGVKESF